MHKASLLRRHLAKLIITGLRGPYDSHAHELLPHGNLLVKTYR